MSDQEDSTPKTGEAGSQSQDGNEDPQDKTRREAIEDRVKQGLGVLGTMRDAIEETIREVRERGDLSPEHAKEVVRGALDKAQEKAGEARDAFDFVKQKDFDGLQSLVGDLKARMGIVEEKVGVESDEEAVKDD